MLKNILQKDEYLCSIRIKISVEKEFWFVARVAGIPLISIRIFLECKGGTSLFENGYFARAQIFCRFLNLV